MESAKLGVRKRRGAGVGAGQGVRGKGRAGKQKVTNQKATRLGGFEHHSVAGCEQWPDLPGQHHQRIVPRHNQTTHAAGQTRQKESLPTLHSHNEANPIRSDPISLSLTQNISYGWHIIRSQCVWSYTSNANALYVSKQGFGYRGKHGHKDETFRYSLFG